MKCYVYRSARRSDAYVFLPSTDDFEALPEELMRQLGRLELAMELDLTPARKLAHADATTVLEALRQQGFYLQMPRHWWRSA